MEEMRVINHAGSELSQAMIGGEVALPVGKPEMESVLMVTARAETGLAELLEGKALVDGTVTLTVCYRCAEGKIHAFESVSSFKHTAQSQLAHGGMRGTAQAWVCSVDYTLMDARRLHISAAVDVLVTMEEETGLHLVSAAGLSEDVVARTKEIAASVTAGATTTAVQLEGMTELTGAPVDRILFCEGRAVVQDCFFENGTVGIQGTVKLAVVYTTQEEHTPVAQAFVSFPFEEAVNLSHSGENCRVRARVRVKDLYPEIDESGLQLHVQAVCGVEVTLEETAAASAVTDAYSLSGALQLETTDICIRRRTASTDGSAAVRERAYATKAQKVLAAWATPSTTRAYREGDSIVMEAMLSCSVLYMEEGGQLASFVQEIPARIVEELPQLEDAQDVEAVIAVEQVQAVPSGDEFDIRVLLWWTADGYALQQETVVREMLPAQNEEPRPKGIVVYFAAAEETLWDVAKRYRTHVDEICRCNPDAADPLREGDRLVLVCR